MISDERRKNRRPRSQASGDLRLFVAEASGPARMVPANITNAADEGVGISTASQLEPGSFVWLVGNLPNGSGQKRMRTLARVAWCTPTTPEGFHAGLQFQSLDAAPDEVARLGIADYYEILEVSPTASPETIHRVHRYLAQRFHPDNKDTGNDELFRQLMDAYHVLSDPEKRAAYDIQRQSVKRAQWRIFCQGDPSDIVTHERRKRQAILSLLYTKRVRQPTDPHVSLLEFEDLLACPREHLEFSLWYLKEQTLAIRTDNGRFAITARGVDQVETALQSAPEMRRLIEGPGRT